MTIKTKSKQGMGELLFFVTENVLNHFLKKSKTEIVLLIYLCMDFMCPIENTVLLKIDVIPRVDTLVQHLNCLEGFQ